MCLSTVYIRSENEQKAIMTDVALVEAEGRQGFWFKDLEVYKQKLEATWLFLMI